MNKKFLVNLDPVEFSRVLLTNEKKYYVNYSAVVIDHFAEVRTGEIPGYPGEKYFEVTNDTLPDVNNGGGIRDWHKKRRTIEEIAAKERWDGFRMQAENIGVEKGHRRHLMAFLEAVEGRGDSPCPISDSILATVMSFKAIESLKKGHPVKIWEN